MRVWIDLANSPHVPLFGPVVDALRARGDEVLLTVRDHAQTLPLARERWPEVRTVGGESPGGRSAKGATLIRRAWRLAVLAADERPDVALSHGSYAQLIAARALGVAGVTMMDYEHQPANHLSFRLARRVLVPSAFPPESTRRFGAARKVIIYKGFKEELYLGGSDVDPGVLERLGVDPADLVIVMRPPPDGALYHRHENVQFERLLEAARMRPATAVVLLPRTQEQQARYGSLEGIIVPQQAVDGRSLLAFSDALIGGGGTMNREAALLGTPAYTVFEGRLAAVDAALIETGLLHDLRGVEHLPELEKRTGSAAAAADRGRHILAAVLAALDDVVAERRRRTTGRLGRVRSLARAPLRGR